MTGRKQGPDVKQPTLMQQSSVKVAEIDARHRLRPVSEAGVQSLIASVTETGVMKDAIHVRRKKDGSLVLIAGAHRLEMARQLGWEEIEAKVWTDVTDDWSRLMEIDDNLAGAEMNALDTAVFLATRKEVYERLHPETRAAAFKGNRHTGSLVADTMSVASFAVATAEKFGLTDRHVRRMISAGSSLHPDQVRALRQAPKPITLKDLTEIAKITQPTDRYAVVDRLAAGRAKSAADALRSLRAEAAGDAPVKDPVEEQFLALMKVWTRTGAAARRRMVAAAEDDVRAILADLDRGDA